MLGIPFMDVVRVLASILLIGNVEFAPRGSDDAYDVEIIGKDELNSVASLLGVPTTLLCQGLTSRTHSARGQPVKSMSDANLVRRRSTFAELMEVEGLRSHMIISLNFSFMTNP